MRGLVSTVLTIVSHPECRSCIRSTSGNARYLMRRIAILLPMMVLAALAKAQTPPHYYHQPVLTGVTNSFFLVPRSLFIFTQPEIAGMVAPVTGPVEITALWLRHGGGSDGIFTDLTDFSIRMGHTTLVDAVPVFEANFNAGSPQTVLSQALYTYTPIVSNVEDPADGWTIIQLDTPFLYNFSDNLCIELSFTAYSDAIAPNYGSIDAWTSDGTPLSQHGIANGDAEAGYNAPRPMVGFSVAIEEEENDETCFDYLPADASPGSFVVPPGVQSISVKMWGAAGGSGPTGFGDDAGGGGGYAEFVMQVTPGEEFELSVGIGGEQASAHIGGAGGWPGGGDGGSGNRVEAIFDVTTEVGGAGGGGGATLFRRVSDNTLIAVAGGGGGGALGRVGGAGGGTEGLPTLLTNDFSQFGFGGTQTAGGQPSDNEICTHPVFGTAGDFLLGGDGATDLGGIFNDRVGGGGGGSGYYGGGGGGSYDGCFGVGSVGGGGSGFLLCEDCPEISGFISTGMANEPANAGDPLLDLYPGTATGAGGEPGGGGLIRICYSVSCVPTQIDTSITACGSYTNELGDVFTQSGTYTYTLTAGSCDTVVNLILTLLEIPLVQVEDAAICPGASVTLTPSGAESYTWTPAQSTAPDGSITVSATETTVYTVVGTDNNGCASEPATATVTMLPTPDAAFTFSPLNPDADNAAVTFTNLTDDAVEAIWTIDGEEAGTSVDGLSYSFPNQSGEYTVELWVVNSDGCSATSTTTLVIGGVFTLFVPNAFTPNGDGINEVFGVTGTGFSAEDYQLEIFDRWGDRVFSSTDPSEIWTGNKSGSNYFVPDGVYTYSLTVRPESEAAPKNFRGHVVLFR